MKVRRPALRCLSPLPTTARRSPKKPASRYTRPRRTARPRTTACKRSAPGLGALSLNSADALPGRRALIIGRAPALFYDLGAVERHRTTKIAVSSPFAYLTSGFMSALRVPRQQLISAADLGLKYSDHRFTQFARTPAPTLIPLEMTGWRFFRGLTRKFHLSQGSPPSESPAVTLLA